MALLSMSGCRSTPPPMQVFDRSISGRVMEIRASDSSFTVISKSQESDTAQVMDLTADLNTKFLRALSVAGLEPDDLVYVEYEQVRGGKFLAKKVHLLKRAPETPKKAAPELF